MPAPLPQGQAGAHSERARGGHVLEARIRRGLAQFDLAGRRPAVSGKTAVAIPIYGALEPSPRLQPHKRTPTVGKQNRDSRFHLSLHISYPNERDKKRAKELGVSPGGDIMIHGIKNGFSWVGELHTEVDWTKGCIAVTDEEMEEIYKLAPNGTLVEIMP